MRLAACMFLALLASLAPVAGAGARGSDPSPLEGTWKARKATTQQLVARGMFPSRWSLFRDRLTFSALPGRSSIIPITIFPWVRVR